VSRRWSRGEWLLAAGAAVAALALLELGVRWLEPQPAVRYRYSADTFYTPIPNARFVYRRREFAVPIEYNAHGMRDRARERAKPPGTLRVALAGDSQTEAKEVPFDSTWGQHLERGLGRRLPAADVEVLNFGVSGFGTVATLARFETLGRHFAPDVVVYLFNDNDPTDNVAAPDRELYTLSGGRLELRRRTDRGPERLGRAMLDPIKQHLQAYSFVRFRLLQLRARPRAPAGAGTGVAVADSAVAAREWVVMRAALARFLASARDAGAELVVAQAGSRDEDMARRLRAACAELGIELIDLRPAFAVATPVHYRWDGHWRPIGHRLAAAALEPRLAARLQARAASRGADQNAW
jgi:hypothetical protein